MKNVSTMTIVANDGKLVTLYNATEYYKQYGYTHVWDMCVAAGVNDPYKRAKRGKGHGTFLTMDSFIKINAWLFKKNNERKIESKRTVKMTNLNEFIKKHKILPDVMRNALINKGMINNNCDVMPNGQQYLDFQKNYVRKSRQFDNLFIKPGMELELMGLLLRKN